MLCRYVHRIRVGLHLSCTRTLSVGKVACFPPPLSPHSCCLPGGIRRARLLSTGGKEDRASAGRPLRLGGQNPALALRRAAERGAFARPASRGLVSICPFCLLVKFAGENPMIRAEPLGGQAPLPPAPNSDRWKK